MAIEKMKFISACTDPEHRDAMLLAGMNTGLVQPVIATKIINDDNNGSVISTENPYQDYVQTFKSIAHAVGCDLNVKEKITSSYTNAEIEAYIKELNEEFGLDNVAQSETLSPDDEKALKELSVLNFEKMHACNYLNFGFGRLPMDSFKKLSLYREEMFVLHRLHSTAQYVWLVYVTSDTYAAKTFKIFQSLFFEPITIRKFDIQVRVEQCRIKMVDMYSYCVRQSSICNMYPYVAVLDQKQILSGFVKASDVETYKAAFNGLPVDFRIKEPSEVKDIKCPTLLKNSWFFKPFELFIEMYGLPAYDDFDPTVFIGITYCILFGIMFGDFGQGLVLMILGFLFEKKGKLFGIVGRVGITSSIFGFLFGSVFGHETLLNPVHQSLFGVRDKLFEVMASSSTMVLLIGAIAIGAVLILVTMIMNMWNRARKKEWAEFLFSQNGVAGFVFYGFIIVAAVLLAIAKVNVLKPLFVVPFIVVPIILFMMKEAFERKFEGHSFKPEDGWGNYFLMSFFETFEILLSFVTNSMSYLRVGGFVLSHAGMMLVVMTLVKMTGNAGIIIAVLGNIFVMALEGLIVGIQTLRLEYYEMFSRYYNGGGIKYQAYTAEDAE